MHMYVHGSLDYTITKRIYVCVGSLDYTVTNAYVRAWFSRLYYDKCICACMVLKIIPMTNANVRAWFSRLYYDKCI